MIVQAIILPQQPPILALAVGIISVLVYQFYVHSYFSGEQRGEFEYLYRQSLIDGRIKRYVDRLTYNPTICAPLLLKKMETEPDPYRRYEIYMTLAWFAARDEQHQNAIEYLQESLALKNNDLVASFRLGQSWERLGKGAEALQAYEMALHDPSLTSPPLREFVLAQVDRVKKQGPHKGVPYPYFKYLGI